MPSPEEFAGGGSGATMTPERMRELQQRAREIRHAAATRSPIPGTGVGMAQVEEPEPEYAPPAPPQRMGQVRPAGYPGYVPPAAPVPQPYPQVPVYQPAQPRAATELEMVRQRFKLASYYEALLDQPVFGDDINVDEYAATVQAELTEWATNRMAELAGVRNNPEGFLDDEVQLLKRLAQGLGHNGVLALVSLADRVLNPPPPPMPAAPAPETIRRALTPPGGFPAAPSSGTPLSEESFEEEDQGSSAMSMGSVVPEPAAPAPTPQVQQRRGRPTVRRARAPGAPAVAAASAPEPAPEAPPRRPRKRSADPLAAGRAMVAASAQADAAEAQAAAPAPKAAPAAPPPQMAVPVPMPHGLNMTVAMGAKAEESLRSARVIETTGGGVL